MRAWLQRQLQSTSAELRTPLVVDGTMYVTSAWSKVFDGARLALAAAEAR